MPKMLQGDIFVVGSDADVLVVFGHKGFAQISATWDQHAARFREAQGVHDAWSLTEPIEIGSQWIWFASDTERGDRGLTTASVVGTLARAAEWANARGYRSLMTNGCRAKNKHLANVRARLLVCASRELESDFALNIGLVSLDDVYVRNRDVIREKKEAIPTIFASIGRRGDITDSM